MNDRLPIIAGNWKLNHGPTATRDFFAGFLERVPSGFEGTIAFFPPALSLAAAREALGDRTEIVLGVQNIFWEDSGAFTGEVSAPLAADAGARIALVGHSERRHVFGESDEDTARKTHAALDAGLRVILCVGETLEEREAGRATTVVDRQLRAVLQGFDAGVPDGLLIAYEPVWAIGTGRTASPDDASEMHRFIHDSLNATPVLYGGSVKPENTAELLAAPGVDGVLVGGASLDPESFARICAEASTARRSAPDRSGAAET